MAYWTNSDRVSFILKALDRVVVFSFQFYRLPAFLDLYLTFIFKVRNDYITPALTLLLFPSIYKEPVNYIGFIQTIQDNFPISILTD